MQLKRFFLKVRKRFTTTSLLRFSSHERSLHSRGFTFVEVLVVVAIISILSTLVAGNYVSSKQRGRDAKRKADLSLMLSSLEQYKADYNVYPCLTISTSAECGIGTGSNATEGWDLVGNINNQQTNLPSSYLHVIPGDPTYGNSCSNGAKGYLYWHAAGKQQFAIFANLENTNDPAALELKPAPPTDGVFGQCVSGSGKCAQFVINAGSCATTTYNYWVTNP